MKSYLQLLVFLLLSSFALNAQNNALEFDGQSEFLSVSHNNAYNIGNGFTIEAWIYAYTWRDQIWQGSIVNKDNQSPDRGYGFRCGANGSLSFVMSADNAWNEVFSGPIMNTNQWHHVAVVIDNNNMRLYIDGQQVASNTYTGTPVNANDMEINIGGSPGFGGRNFHGIIDEVRIWNTARTQQEIADNNTEDLTGSESGLVTYFPMNEGVGTVTNDISSTGTSAGFNNMDASNWINGYTLPDFDVSVQEVYGVDVINMIDRPVKMSVDLQNTGTQAISNVGLTLNIDGQFYVSETVTASIAPGDLYTYEFKLPIDLIGTNDPEVEVVAAHPDDQNALNNAQEITVKTGSSSNAIVSDKVLHKNGELFNSVKLNLPNDLHKYEQILLNIDLTCPTGGCGAWDVLADLKAVTSTGNYEIARYITPYGIACGGWVVDITDFKSVLGGLVEFQTTIFVYTEEGWLVDMSIDLIDNNNTDTYHKLSPLWGLDYQVYGDPNISYDLAPVNVPVETATQNSHVRMVVTGHGQGNTNNAAEFFNVTHNLNVNGAPFHDHNLWNSDCPSNPCSNQAGNWSFPRAGWCPGESVDPYIINTTSVMTPGSNISLDYELQNYNNLLNTGYNGNSHTEPYYKLYSYFIEESSTPYNDYRNLTTTNIDPDINGNVLDAITVSIANDGFTDLSNYTVNIFMDNQLIATEAYSDFVSVGSSVDKTIVLSQMLMANVGYNIFAEVVQIDDMNPGDNVIKAQISTSIDNYITADYPFDMLPNPTSNGQITLKYDAFWNGSTVQVYSANGALVRTFTITNTESFELPHTGMFYYHVTHATDGYQLNGKLMYVK